MTYYCAAMHTWIEAKKIHLTKEMTGGVNGGGPVLTGALVGRGVGGVSGVFYFLK